MSVMGLSGLSFSHNVSVSPSLGDLHPPPPLPFAWVEGCFGFSHTFPHPHQSFLANSLPGRYSAV